MANVCANVTLQLKFTDLVGCQKIKKKRIRASSRTIDDTFVFDIISKDWRARCLDTVLAMKIIQRRDARCHVVCFMDIRQREPLIMLSNVSRKGRASRKTESVIIFNHYSFLAPLQASSVRSSTTASGKCIVRIVETIIATFRLRSATDTIIFSVGVQRDEFALTKRKDCEARLYSGSRTILRHRARQYFRITSDTSNPSDLKDYETNKSAKLANGVTMSRADSCHPFEIVSRGRGNRSTGATIPVIV